MVDADALEYRRGRLVLPSGIGDWPPVQVGRWLARVPVSDRARAFRALPLNLAAAGFLTMDPRSRLGLLCGLNPSNVRYLCAIARDEHLIETLLEAGDEVQELVLSALPDWRRSGIDEQLAAERERLAALAASDVGGGGGNSDHADRSSPVVWLRHGREMLAAAKRRLRDAFGRVRRS